MWIGDVVHLASEMDGNDLKWIGLIVLGCGICSLLFGDRGPRVNNRLDEWEVKHEQERQEWLRSRERSK